MMPLPRILYQIVIAAIGMLALVAFAGPTWAHPLPVSSIDLRYGDRQIEGRITVHMRDLARPLAIAQRGNAPDPARFLARGEDIEALLGARLVIGGSHPVWQTIALAPQDSDGLILSFTIPGTPPADLAIAARLFPADREHQTFVNVYEGGELRQQWLLGATDGPVTYYSGRTAGTFAAAGAFLAAGVHHILIGPDHIAFVIGLILLGGTLRRLALIVSAFTLGHSVTLTLAALGMFALPATVVEPAIALSIVVVGVDNLLRGEGRDLRPLIACAFGLIHGFGFAYVLRDFGLPEAHRVAALLSFNLGVELGQLAIVLPVAMLLALVRRHSEVAGRRLAQGGSLAVAATGAYWFIQRVFMTGSGS